MRLLRISRLEKHRDSQPPVPLLAGVKKKAEGAVGGLGLGLGLWGRYLPRGQHL
jgi:hypothetical protein